MSAIAVPRWSQRIGHALIALLVGLLIVGLHAGGYLRFFDAELEEARFNLVRSDPSPQIAIVAIDANSLEQRPLWPWPRSWHAALIDRLVEAGAAQIVLDIDFSAASTPIEDAALADALRRAGERVILPVFQQPAQQQSNALIENFPMAALAERARIASANIRADGDGIVRRMPPLAEWGGALVPTLAGAAAGSRSRDDFLIDYGIRAEGFTTISYVDVLEGRAPSGAFAGKIVFVGATALELGDVAATPVNGLTPGLMVQALGTSSLLQGRALHKVIVWPILVLTIALFFAVARQCRGRHWLAVAGLGAAWSAGIFALSTAVQMVAPVMLDAAPLILSVVTAIFASLVGRVRDLDLTVVGQTIALRRSSNLMRRVVENTFDGLLTLDRDGTIKSANPAAERILGRKSAELVERSFASFVPSLPAEKGAAWLAYLAEERQPQEASVQGPDGVAVATEIAVTRLPDEPSAAFIVVLRDIVERTAAIAAAARNLNRLKDAIDSIGSGFALFDADERLVTCNQHLRALYPSIAHMLVPGWHVEDLVRAKVIANNPGAPGHEIERQVADRLRRFRNPGEAFEYSAGGNRWLQISERRTSEGGIVGIHTDITQARQQESQLRAAYEQAQVASRTKSQFLANMSHELRTPLNAVIGFSEVMKAELMGPLGSELYRGYTKDIHDSATHLLAIINDILDISSIESGVHRLKESLLSPEEVCRSVETLMSGRMEWAGIQLVVSVKGVTGGLWADNRLVKQMLLNLVSNAVKFSASDTRILLSVTQTGDRAIRFSVEDQGIGIAAADIERILRPFEQVENAWSRSHDGVGLGLALVQSMVQAHDAALRIDSAVGEGTTVTIVFPPARTRDLSHDDRPRRPRLEVVKGSK
ncbi:MAG TPA: CHASE2 domain-containing protein [Dongiaceae bacterium]|nr:CHASE2 domain-containing protein [Dongiaceae bacterium]